MLDTYSHSNSTRTAFIVILLTVASVAIAVSSGTVAAAPEANVTVSDTPAEPVQPGDSFTFDIILTNDGTEDGTVTDIRVQDEPNNISAPNPQLGLGTLGPGESKTETITVSIGENVSDGEYTLTAYGDVGGEAAPDTEPVTFTVNSSPPLSVDLAPDTIDVDESTEVTVSVTEAGSAKPVPSATVTRISEVETTQVNSSGKATLSFKPTEIGSITLDITAPGYLLTTTNITVVSGGPDTDQFDTDGDGEIGREDTVDVIIAYNQDNSVNGKSVSRDEAVAVIKAYKK